jgi:hypothetical protein
MGIFDEDCFALAEMHSNAVDCPKSGTPVNTKTIPRQKRNAKPDWDCPETLTTPTVGKFYSSTRAIGQLSRGINLPVDIGSIKEGATWISSNGHRNTRDSRIFPVQKRVGQSVQTGEIGGQFCQNAEKLFSQYKAQLQGICVTKSLSSSRHGSLTEEEAFIGTISQRFTDQRRRKDMLSRLRESTDALVRHIRYTLEGGKAESGEDFLRRSWCAWQVALNKGSQFGAQSFGWLALGCILEAISAIQERDIGPTRNPIPTGLPSGTSLGKRRAQELEDDGERCSSSQSRQKKVARTYDLDHDVIDLTVEEPEVIGLTGHF